MTALLLAYDPNDVRPGWIALLLVVALAVATYLLWRSMNTQLGRISMLPREKSSAPQAGSTHLASTDADGDEQAPAPPSD